MYEPEGIKQWPVAIRPERPAACGTYASTVVSYRQPDQDESASGVGPHSRWCVHERIPYHISSVKQPSSDPPRKSPPRNRTSDPPSETSDRRTKRARSRQTNPPGKPSNEPTSDPSGKPPGTCRTDPLSGTDRTIRRASRRCGIGQLAERYKQAVGRAEHRTEHRTELLKIIRCGPLIGGRYRKDVFV
jgi:hypothetical protein